MARCIAPLLLVLAAAAAAQDTSSPSCTEAGRALLQTNRHVSPAHPADSPAKDFLLDKVAPGAKADAMDNEETNNAAKDKEVTNHTDEANSAAPDNKEATNADEADAAYASALKNVANGFQDEGETNSADAADRQETNNADEGQAAHPSNRRAMDSTVLDTKEYLLSKQEATRHSKKDAKRHSHSAKSKNAAKATVPLESAPASKKKVGLSGSLLASSPRLSKGDFCRSHPCSFLAVGDKRRGLGGTASLDEAGYQSVAELKDDEEMKQFILRVVEDYDCKVDKMGGLMGIVPWFSGTTAVQSLEKLNESLLFAVLANGERWISYKNTAGVTGADVPLDLEGYVQVAIIRSAGETQKFARRLAEQMGIEITGEGGFEGMIKYYDGSATFQSFDKLREEVRSAAATPNTWAKFKSM